MSTKQDAPAPDKLVHGDLIWPKKPGQFIPYTSQPTGDYASDREQWEYEKSAYISSVENSDASTYEKALVSWLEDLSYDEFRETYIGEKQDELLGAFGLPAPYVGHVGIISVENGEPWVVEAVSDKGVQKITYVKWLQDRSDADVWQKRFDGFGAVNIEQIVNCAKEHLSKPYGFFNLNLNSDKSFYCSKLIWYAVFNTIDIALDDNPNPERFIWYSPKQLIHSRYLECIHCPGPYFASPDE